jgi:hypothetical protein
MQWDIDEHNKSEKSVVFRRIPLRGLNSPPSFHSVSSFLYLRLLGSFDFLYLAILFIFLGCLMCDGDYTRGIVFVIFREAII